MGRNLAKNKNYQKLKEAIQDRDPKSFKLLKMYLKSGMSLNFIDRFGGIFTLPIVLAAKTNDLRKVRLIMKYIKDIKQNRNKWAKILR